MAKWKESLSEYADDEPEKPTKKKKKDATGSRECACGFWLGESNYSSVTKSYFCPSCSCLLPESE